MLSVAAFIVSLGVTQMKLLILLSFTWEKLEDELQYRKETYADDMRMHEQSSGQNFSRCKLDLLEHWTTNIFL